VGGVIAAGLSVVKNTLDNVGRVELDPDMIGINPQVDSELRNYRNIALIGIDARDMSNDEGVRSDAIIVASLNKETGEIKMFSVYRDTMLDLGDDVGLDKVTHSYYYGGPTKVLYALNKNLDLNVKEVVIVNWKSVADTVDALGGLDIEIQESEIDEMNKYIEDTYNSIGGSNEKIESAGMQTLNGNQAVTYARIRKDAATGDFRRNERMKIVVQAAFEKAKTMKLSTLRKITNDILPDIKTNMSSADMMGMMMDITSYKMTDSVGWPYEHSDWSEGAYYNIPVTLSENVSRLHEEFFAQDGYEPTQDVQSISENISWRTGYY
ncbi:MAG: LCP family protein, partial [Anaerovoracaceae bacterium]